VKQSQNNFYGANSVLEISTALDNLAMAATMDWDIVPELTESNKQLTNTNKILIEQLKTSIEANTVLTNCRHHQEDDQSLIKKHGKPDLTQTEIVGPTDITSKKATGVQTAKENLEAIRMTPPASALREDQKKEKIDT
jgi:hypothetical protein